ncbi:MAG: molybdopterin-guanine dinucleotide biosynthesis protein B [Dorea sp.]|nr:molybdopterin-guanine dinucleotide biosynthesis protein B [Dorea sp.]
MQKIIAICGIKNSGKTTLTSKLVAHYSSLGKKVAVIKHDGHDFSCDLPGTDSFRMTEAGAYGTAVFSDYRIFIHKIGTKEREQMLIKQFPEADIIFLEGFKDSEYQKIEVVRSERSHSPVSNPKGRFLIATDLPLENFKEKAKNINDIIGISKEIDLI